MPERYPVGLNKAATQIISCVASYKDLPPCVSGTLQGQRATARRGRQSRQAEHRPQTPPLPGPFSVILTHPAPPQALATLPLANAVYLFPHAAASAPVTSYDPEVGGQGAEGVVSPTDAPGSPSLPPLCLAAPVFATAA